MSRPVNSPLLMVLRDAAPDAARLVDIWTLTSEMGHNTLSIPPIIVYGRFLDDATVCEWNI